MVVATTEWYGRISGANFNYELKLEQAKLL